MIVQREIATISVHQSSACSKTSSSFSQIFLVLAFIVFIILIIDFEQLVLPLLTRLAAVLSGETASFLRKGHFVVMESEGDGGVPVS